MSGTERPLGKSGVSVPALGVGTNRWNTGEPGQASLNETLAAAVDVGLASKFAPLPTRLTVAQFDSALDQTLKRLGRESLDLYYLHFPYSLRGVDT